MSSKTMKLPDMGFWLLNVNLVYCQLLTSPTSAAILWVDSSLLIGKGLNGL